MTKKLNMGVMVLPEDKDLIRKACQMQRRSMASFLVECAIKRAKEIIKENKGATA